MSTVSADKIQNREKTKTVQVISIVDKLAAILGPRSAAPTTREDGSALQPGDNYFNTVSSIEYIYKSGAWAVR